VTVAAHTLGCKVNQCDTEALLARLVGIGCTLRKFNQQADIYIINTCTVTHASDKKSRQIIRRAKKQNPSAKIAVCGCMMQQKTETSEIEADFIFDARKPDAFIKFLQSLCPEADHKPLIYTPTRTRAFIKVQDGCDRFCAYCIVPYVRGKPVSRPVHDILTEARDHIANGVLEIVLTGIQIASYADGANSLPELIKQTAALTGLKRLRLSSLDPCAITDEFLQAAKESSHILCDHFHLSLQSGSDNVLNRMNRRYTTAQYSHSVQKLRQIFPNAAITTDIIVGFPGETAEEFEQSFTFAKKIGFAAIHVFEYSRRDGTPAATFAGQVTDKIKSDRSYRMRTRAARLEREFYQSQVGRTASVLFESENSPGKWQGHTSNYCLAEIICNEDLTNIIRELQITRHFAQDTEFPQSRLILEDSGQEASAYAPSPLPSPK